MERLLIKWNDNLADEMDIEGHFVMYKKGWECMQEDARKITSKFYYCIGSNEEIEYKNGKEALEHFTSESITEEEYEVLEKLDLTISGFTGPDFGLDLEEDEDYSDNMETDEDDNLLEEEFKFWRNDINNNHYVTITLRFDENERERKIKVLEDEGYVVTYKGKFGETWELR